MAYPKAPLYLTFRFFIPVRVCSCRSKSAIHVLLVEARFLSRSNSASYPARRAPPSVKSIGSSSARALSNSCNNSVSHSIRPAYSLATSLGKLAHSSCSAGSIFNVSRIPPSSRGLRKRFCKRVKIRGISRTKLRDSPSRLDEPRCLCNTPTIA